MGMFPKRNSDGQKSIKTFKNTVKFPFKSLKKDLFLRKNIQIQQQQQQQQQNATTFPKPFF